MSEQFELHLTPKRESDPMDAPDEFAGMDLEELIQNIARQETRLASRIVDQSERLDIEGLIERMKIRATEESNKRKVT